MSRLLSQTLVGLSIVATVSAGISAMRWIDARRDAGAAQSTTARVAVDAQEVLRLRDADEHLALSDPPQQDVLQRVRRVLTETGIGEDRLASLASRSDAAVPDETGQRERTYTLALDRMNTPLLGQWLATWIDTEPMWRVSSIELAEATRGRGDAVFPFRVTLELSARYADLDTP